MDSIYRSTVQAADPTTIRSAIAEAVYAGNHPVLVIVPSIDDRILPVISDWADYIDMMVSDELGFIDYATLNRYPRVVAAVYRGMLSMYELLPTRDTANMLDEAKKLYMNHFE